MAKKRPVPAGRNDKKRGGARMVEMGYREVRIYLDAKEADAINRASRKDQKRLATWVRDMAYFAATQPEYRQP